MVNNEEEKSLLSEKPILKKSISNQPTKLPSEATLEIKPIQTPNNNQTEKIEGKKEETKLQGGKRRSTKKCDGVVTESKPFLQNNVFLKYQQDLAASDR